ncbi:hypothetical protein ABH922_003015 [Rhodococcus sp. 27YEA15]|uniref:hypothetical protein n=1 Tax=Rhodococcus sp. 27YEA15 TaxID=3156259 RepID=UPI003C7A2E21
MERGTVYIDGKPFGTVNEIQFTPDGAEEFGGKTVDTRTESAFTVSVEYLNLPPVVAYPPKRPPDPERPFWADNPGRTRRTKYGPTARVK